MVDGGVSAIADRRHRFERPGPFWDRVALGAVVVGAILRIVWILVGHRPTEYIYSDMKEYVVRAAQLASGVPLTPDDAFFPPGTEMVLAVPLAIFGTSAGIQVAAVVWCLLSIGTVYMAWRLARELLTPAAAAITAISCAVWPLFITYGGFFASETPALAFLVAALWAGAAAVHRGGRTSMGLAALSGALGGAASTIRPQLLINVVIMAAVLVMARRARAALFVAFTVGLIVATGPVIVHNSVASRGTAVSTSSSVTAMPDRSRSSMRRAGG